MFAHISAAAVHGVSWEAFIQCHWRMCCYYGTTSEGIVISLCHALCIESVVKLWKLKLSDPLVTHGPYLRWFAVQIDVYFTYFTLLCEWIGLIGEAGADVDVNVYIAVFLLSVLPLLFSWPCQLEGNAVAPVTLHCIKVYFVPGLWAGPAGHYKCYEENKRNKS